jgi:hypothetical protein
LHVCGCRSAMQEPLWRSPADHTTSHSKANKRAADVVVVMNKPAWLHVSKGAAHVPD